MAETSRRDRGVHLLIIFLTLLCAAAPAVADMLQPLDGGGNFHTYVEVVNRWRDEQRLDVLVLVEVSNADLGYNEEGGGLVGRLRLEVDLESLDGDVISEKRQVRTAPLDAVAARSSTLRQVFGLLLEDVPFRAGRVTCRVYDVNRRRQGLLNEMNKRSARSECSSLWYAEDGPRPERSLALGDPLFLAHAPLASWNPDNAARADATTGWLHDFVHPSRRYGLEEDHLQIFLPIWPQAGGVELDSHTPQVRVQITSLEMDFVVNDTIRVDERGRVALRAGRPAALFYELDVNLLPAGAYRLSLAPLSGFGRGVLKDFSVVWSLANLARHHHQVLGEGRMVFGGAELEKFLAGSPNQQDRMLEDFWEKLNPDPGNPVNESYLEFQYRIAYVQQFLGGFGEFGPVDDRGEVFILLGPPDEMQIERMPMNDMDQDDARIKVFQRFAPDRGGTFARGSSLEGTSEPLDPYNTEGGVPMPHSPMAERGLDARRASPVRNQAFELWKYDRGGNALYVNRFSYKGMGQRFLFVDRTGTGEYFLESSNVLQGED